MRWWPVAFVAFVAVVAAVPMTAVAADQASITRTGWWTRNPVASAPDGGLDVSMGPDGAPLSVAAIEVAASATVTRAVLTLAEAGGIAQQGAVLVVCTTGDEWTSGPGQPIDDAPSPACGTGNVAMTRNAASATWAADVTPLLRDVARDGSASLMVVPMTSDLAPLGYDVQLRAPQLQSEVTTGAPATTTTSTTSPPASTTTPPPQAPPPRPVASPPATGSDGYDPTIAAAVRDAATPTTSTSSTTPRSAAEEEAIEAITEPRPIGSPLGDEDPLPGPWWQVALVVLIGDLLVLGRRLAERVQQAQRASTGT